MRTVLKKLGLAVFAVSLFYIAILTAITNSLTP
jgi:hypothetical protein